MFELITFDLDDTLWDAGPVLARAEQVHHAWLETYAPAVTARFSVTDLQRYRRQLAADDVRLRHDFTALRRAALTRLLADFGYDPARADDCVAAFLAARSSVELYPDTLACLTELKRHFRLAAITNGNVDLAQTGVRDFFEFALSPADTGTSKPDPAMFAAALHRARVSADAVAHVGDEPFYDIEGAHRAGLGAVWLNRHGAPWPADHRPAHAEIASLAELPAALAGLKIAQ